MDEDEQLERLAGFIADGVAQCRDHGMELPFVIFASSANGSTCAACYFQSGPGDKLGCEVLGDHTLDSGFEFPINIMIVDQTGEAVRIEIEQLDQRFIKAPRDWAVPPVHGEFVNLTKMEWFGRSCELSRRHRATVDVDDSPAHARRAPAGHHCQTPAPGWSTATVTRAARGPSNFIN